MKKFTLLILLAVFSYLAYAYNNRIIQTEKINPTSNYQMIHPTNIETPTSYPATGRTFLN
ncbi:MAG: hypothetical protein KA049_02000 [Burkholderiales bacterium]|jgi:hypothetical protein|nr:hypothetical protein [Burkholderiales bacterium]MBP9768307.1 hypothetical protein [Burkholderiales bacterium]